MEVTDLSHQGLGVAHVEGYPIFIENALPDEHVKILVTHTGRRMGHAKTIEIIKQSEHRVEVQNDVYTQNGTMPLQHLAYSEQLKFKQNQVKKQFNRAGLSKDIPVLETIGMDNPYRYRNKAQIPIREVNGQLTTGFYKKGTHDLIPIEDFIIQDPKIDETIVIVRDILQEYQITAYNEQGHTGDIRHIVVRRGHFTGEIMIVLVTRSFLLPNANEIVNEIRKNIPEVVSIIQNINDEKTNVILGKQSMVLFGQDYYTDELLGHTFKISHQSFYQVNSEQTEKLYRIAVDYAGLTGKETVIDAYCGIGTMTLALAQRAKQVYGVEIVPQAIENAKKNATDNQITNVDFTVGDAGKWMVKQVKSGLSPDVVVVDPPRKGLTEQFIKAVLEVKPEQIVYVSCNPSTLARDLKIFNDGSYKIVKAQPVDMFPQTYHVECVALMSRVGE